MYEDFYQQQPTATWNSARGVWETNQVNLLCGHSEPFLETWPTSGMTRNGQVFELPTQEHHTTASESLLLRSPVASEAEGGAMHEDDARAGNHTLKLGWQVLGHFGHIQPKRVLPTPVVNDMGAGKTVERWDEWTAATKEKHQNGNGHGPSLSIELLRLLPTPVASEGTKAPAQQDAETKGKTGQVWLSNVAKGISNETLLPTVTTSEGTGPGSHGTGGDNLRTVASDGIAWAQFEPAIRRWEEVLGREAPAPTLPDGKEGQHRLSSKFTEWMMGVPEGWITDVGLKRNDELKACGNGVVPQQAELALRLLLQGTQHDTALLAD